MAEEITWIEVWSRALSGISGEQVAIGLSRCEKERPYPPSNPAEFIALCRYEPVHFGLPSVDEALNIVCGNHIPIYKHTQAERWKHPLVLAASRDKRIDLYRLRLMPTPQAFKAWGPVYLEYVQRFLKGEQFKFSDEIENKQGKAVTPEERRLSRQKGLQLLKETKKRLSA